MENIISVSDLSFGYDSKRKVLENINFQLKKGESVGLVGANGVGKSTLLRILVGLNTGFQGDVMVNNIPLEKKNLKTIRKNVGYVFQDADSQLFMSTVYEDVAFAPVNYGLSEEETKQRVTDALKMMGIEELRDRHTFRLSGGQKKLAAIATILSMTPEIILLDEPTIALDPRNRKNLIGLINSFSQLRVIASHDLDMIMDTCSRVVLMNNGKIIREGSTVEILNDRELLESNGLELPLSLSGHR